MSKVLISLGIDKSVQNDIFSGKVIYLNNSAQGEIIEGDNQLQENLKLAKLAKRTKMSKMGKMAIWDVGNDVISEMVADAFDENTISPSENIFTRTRVGSSTSWNPSE